MVDNRTRVVDTFATYFKEVIYGGIDGIVTTFAVVAGFAGAALSHEATTQLSFLVVLLFGLANLFADAASMGLGNFLSVRSEKDLYRITRSKEAIRLETETDREREETISIIESKGFTAADANALAEIYGRNHRHWLDFMMRNKHDMVDPRNEREVYTGLATFVAFMLFGAIPLVPFMLLQAGDPGTVFLYSCIGTAVALLTLGVLKWYVIGTRFWRSILEVALVGGTAAVLAYFVGTFFAL